MTVCLDMQTDVEGAPANGNSQAAGGTASIWADPGPATVCTHELLCSTKSQAVIHPCRPLCSVDCMMHNQS